MNILYSGFFEFYDRVIGRVFIFLAASPLVRARFCGFAAQSCSRQNRHATQVIIRVVCVNGVHLVIY